MKKFQWLKKVAKSSLGIAKLSSQIEEAKILAAKSLISPMKQHGIYENIHDVEFKVFSQFGEDGIIQYLIHNIDIDPICQKFIEFGVGDYTESNTRFLLMNDNWTGLIIEGSEEDVKYICKDNIYWRYDLTAVNSFIDKENINKIFLDNKFSGEIGILSIDIDGNDYWIWECIEAVNPIVVIVEYNSVFGNKYAITVSYAPCFVRSKAHYSHLYWGGSLKGLCMLAEKKGYYFVGSTSNANNAFFVRKDKIGNIKPLNVEEGYVKSKFRDSRDKQGQLSFIAGDDRIKVIQEMSVYDLERCKLVKIQDIGELTW
jgi:hypothetical protein